MKFTEGNCAFCGTEITTSGESSYIDNGRRLYGKMDVVSQVVACDDCCEVEGLN